MIEAWDVVRWANALIASGIVMVMTMDSIHRWSTLTKRMQRVVPWVVMTYVVIAYGSGEVAAQDPPVQPGLRVVLMSLTLIGLVIALVYRLSDEEESA